MCMTVGWSIFGVGNLLRFAAMRFAAQMVLSGLGSLQFVMIPIVSNFLLGDKYTWEAFVSIMIILGGTDNNSRHKLCSVHTVQCKHTWEGFVSIMVLLEDTGSSLTLTSLHTV